MTALESNTSEDKNMKKTSDIKNAASLLTALAIVAMSVRVSAGCSYDITSDTEHSVIADGFRYEGELLYVEDTAYVSLREFACMADNSVVWWDEEEESAHVVTDSLTLRAPEDEEYIEANGRMLWCEYGVFTENDTLYVPLGVAAKAFGFYTTYIPEEHTTYLVRRYAALDTAEAFYDPEELDWLSRIIHAEAQGEPFRGKLAVGNVILNRVRSEEFPDTIYDVIFDNDHGVQFTPTVNGAINNTPNEDSVIAAKLCLDGASLDDDMLYFLNEEIAESLWIPQNCRFVMSVGEHSFYS